MGVINHGEIVLVENKTTLMEKMGKRQLRLQLQSPLDRLPPALNGKSLELVKDGSELVYTFDAKHEHTGIADLLRQLDTHHIDFKDLQSSQSSLEEIFVNLVRER